LKKDQRQPLLHRGDNLEAPCAVVEGKSSEIFLDSEQENNMM